MLVTAILNHQPTTAGPNDTILSILSRMRDDDTGAVIILDQGDLTGIVTDRDISIGLVSCGPRALTQPVSRVMSSDPLTCFDTQDIVEAAVIMADNQVRRLPVVDHAHHLVGVLSLDDIAENYSEHLAGETLGEIVEKRKSPRKPHAATIIKMG